MKEFGSENVDTLNICMKEFGSEKNSFWQNDRCENLDNFSLVGGFVIA